MGQSPNIEPFWQAYLATLPAGARPRRYSDEIWTFADTRESKTKVGRLVKAGIKTSTSGLVWGLEHAGEAPPPVGGIAIVADGEGEPLCIIEVTEVEIKPFNAVDEQFAFDYGEYGRTLEGWRAESWAYFAEECAAMGREPSEMMPLVCQRFRLLYPKL